MILFAHAAYQLRDEFLQRRRPEDSLEVRTRDALAAHIADADTVVVSGLWSNDLVDRAPRLRFIQSISAGTDQYDKAALAARGIKLASAQGANEEAVAEHALGLMLALARHLHLGRDHQTARHWRPMLSDRGAREWELRGQTLVIVGLGRIGSRLASFARALGMRVIGVKRTPTPRADGVEVVATAQLNDVLGEADVLALTCPLTPETDGLIGAAALAALKPGAMLINVARGRVVDETSLLAALESGRVRCAGLDCFREEPLPATSPFWSLPQVLITPHSAGETRAYESNVIDMLIENIARLADGRPLLNQIVG